MQPYFDTNHAAGLLILIIVPASGNDGTQRIFPRDGRAERSHQDRPARLLARRGGVRDRRHERRALSRPAHRPGGHDPARCRGLRHRHGEPAGWPGAARWSFETLGQYFTFTVMVSSGQPVVATGPYRLLRHPSYTGVLWPAPASALRPRTGPARPALRCCRWPW